MKKSDKKVTILLVEKSDNLRTVLKDYLEMLQFEVNDFKDEILSLKSLTKCTYDICILDMNVEIDERIGQLQEEQKEIGQKVADQEQILYLLEEFIRFKLNKVFYSGATETV